MRKNLNLWARLESLEKAVNAAVCIMYPDDSDGFVTAIVGDDISRFAHGSGYDALVAISSTAADDWGNYDGR